MTPEEIEEIRERHATALKHKGDEENEWWSTLEFFDHAMEDVGRLLTALEEAEARVEEARTILDECWIDGDGGPLFDHELGPRLVDRARRALMEE